MGRRLFSILLLAVGAGLAYAAAALGAPPDRHAAIHDLLLRPIAAGREATVLLLGAAVALLASHALASEPAEDSGFAASPGPAAGISLAVALIAAALAAATLAGHVRGLDARALGVLALAGTAESALAVACALKGALGRGARPALALPALAVGLASAAWFGAVWALGARGG